MTMKPEQTAEQILRDVAWAHPDSDRVAVARMQVNALRAAGLLVSPPSEEQIERADSAERLAAELRQLLDERTSALTKEADVLFLARKDAERERDEAHKTLRQVRAEVDELTRQSLPTGILLRLLAGVAPQEQSEGDEFAPGECRGDSECPAVRHFHGCLADKGNCDDPTDHKPAPTLDREQREKLIAPIKCEWCNSNARGSARHNDGLMHQSCGAHGFDFVALAGDWEKVCDAAGLDPDATADEVVAALAAVPVVDEAKLAEVINSALDAWQGEEPSEVFVSRAVAEWLRGEQA